MAGKSPEPKSEQMFVHDVKAQLDIIERTPYKVKPLFQNLGNGGYRVFIQGRVIDILPWTLRNSR